MTPSTPTSAVPALIVRQAVCHALYAYDVGLSIDLERCRSLVTAGLRGSTIRHNRRAPKYFDYRPAPLLVTQDVQPPAAGAFEAARGVDLLLYDFGAISVSYRLPVRGSLDALRDLSGTLAEDEALLRDSRQRIEDVLRVVRPAIDRAHVSDLTEDYAVFEVDDYDSAVPPDRLHEPYAQELAQVLRAERTALSAQEVADALACRLSFGQDDVTLIDWNAAMVFDRDADDLRAVLEFANVELLEMRILDHRLDDALDRAYEAVSRDSWLRSFLPGKAATNLRRVSQMQVDGALLFERVTNAPKLLGDQYLARAYRLASQRFHLPEWNATTLRKLDALASIYRQMHDRAASRRLELLEWIIILLIAFEIVLPFLRRLLAGGGPG
jgi:hypothetical protein